jgi:hypothetical protein
MAIKKNKLLTITFICFNWMPKWQICYTEMTNLLQFKTNVRKSHRQLQYTLQLACEDRVFFVWISSRFFLIAVAYKMWATNSIPTNKILTELGLELLVAIERNHRYRSFDQRTFRFGTVSLVG